MAGVNPDTVAERVSWIRHRVSELGADPDRIRIVAVTKGFGRDAVEAVVRAGVMDIGENYAQELEAKAPECPPEAVWHFLGPVQRNKVGRLAPLVSVWHAIDRPAAAESVAKSDPGVEVMIQVNVTGAPNRPGCSPGSVAELAQHCRKLPVDLSGLMAVGPAGDLEGSRRCFRWLTDTAAELGLRELSMGMSDDFEVAIAEGATTLRLGRIIFGPRPSPLLMQR